MFLYAAYGSNLNKEQMQRRCPQSIPYDTITLKDWRLVFKGVADIEKKKGHNVYLGLYKITKDCEKQLDVYEGYPEIYGKYYICRHLKGENVKIMYYVMNKRFNYSIPTERYFKVIFRGYKNWSFNLENLYVAGKHSIDNNTFKGYKSKNWKEKKYISLEYFNNFKF